MRRPSTWTAAAPTAPRSCERQRTKLLAALSELDADVFGFMEMENTPASPLADIVADSAELAPAYAYIDTGVIGTDAIRVGIIYKTATVRRSAATRT